MLDILMITHNRLDYLKKALPSVLMQTYKDLQLIVWDNGSDKETVEWLGTLRDPRLSVIYSANNESLASVTSKIFLESTAEFVGKVDADTIVPEEWATRLVSAHKSYHFGFIGGFHFPKEDIIGRNPIIDNFNGVKLWRKHHIGGCSFMIRREDFKGYAGKKTMGLSEYQSEMGLINGYLWDPILWVDHMEDYRSEHYINNEEYNKYKLETHGMTLAQYAGSISHQGYLDENTYDKSI